MLFYLQDGVHNTSLRGFDPIGGVRLVGERGTVGGEWGTGVRGGTPARASPSATRFARGIPAAVHEN
jgi:hypothetical protein